MHHAPIIFNTSPICFTSQSFGIKPTSVFLYPALISIQTPFSQDDCLPSFPTLQPLGCAAQSGFVAFGKLFDSLGQPLADSLHFLFTLVSMADIHLSSTTNCFISCSLRSLYSLQSCFIKLRCRIFDFFVQL